MPAIFGNPSVIRADILPPQQANERKRKRIRMGTLCDPSTAHLIGTGIASSAQQSALQQ